MQKLKEMLQIILLMTLIIISLIALWAVFYITIAIVGLFIVYKLVTIYLRIKRGLNEFKE